MIRYKPIPKEEGHPTYRGTGVWFGPRGLSIDASQNPVLTIRATDGSWGAIVCVDEPAAHFPAKARDLVGKAIQKFAVNGCAKESLEAAIAGGADNTMWKIVNLRRSAQSYALNMREYDLGGQYYRKMYFEPKTGMLNIFKAVANPDDWNPAKAKLSLESGTKGFSDGQAGGVVANATRFFREKNTFTALREHVVPQHLRLTPAQPFLFWSAACSTGAEAYSYAMYIHRLLARARAKCSFKVFATDINKKLVENAKRGEYDVAASDIDSYHAYFERYGKLTGKHMVFGEEIRRYVSFDYFDLKNIPRRKDFNMIVCANVFQYYEDEARIHFLQNFVSAVRRPGYIFVGPLSQNVLDALQVQKLNRHKLLCVE